MSATDPERGAAKGSASGQGGGEGEGPGRGGRGARGSGRGPRGKGDRGEGEPIGELLPGLLRRLGIAEGVARQDAIARWSDTVGIRIAEVTEPTGISGEVLFVRVSSSAWLNELNLMRHDLLARLNAGRREGRIERIVFTLAERPLSGGPGTDPRSEAP